MSDYKPNENQNGADEQELFDLLDRLEQQDQARRRRAEEPFYFPETTDLITVEEPDPDSPEENMTLPVDHFQSTAMTAEQVHDLLIVEGDFDGEEEDEEDAPLPAAPQKMRNPFKALWAGFCGNLPRKEDSTGTKWRKGGFLFSLLVMVVAAIYLLVDLLIIPALNRRLKDDLIDLYHPEDTHVVSGSDNGNYPKNMLASFKDLYDRNPDVRGWISFHASGKKDFLDIEYPIVYRDVEDKTNPYLKMDFDGNRNKNGTLYFDQQNNVDRYTAHSDALVVYGHNMASGQMFAGLNKFMGSVNNARVAPTLTLSTLFRRDEFKVFAVVLLDESDLNARSMDIWKTKFLTDASFFEQVAKIRARSLFDYPVDVMAEDQLLVLSTCTGKTSAHVKDGRLVVVARRVRDGESAAVDTNAIVKNTDVIMPYYWYINQNKKPHQYYTDIGMDQPVSPNLPTASVATTTTVTTVTGTDDTTTATGEGDTATTTVEGVNGDETTTQQSTVGTTTAGTSAAGTSDGTTTAGATTAATTTQTNAPTEGTTTTVTEAPTAPPTTTTTAEPTAAPTTEPTTAPTEVIEE